MKKLIYLIIIFLGLSLATSARAATLSFDPQENTIGPEQPFDVGLLIDAPQLINALSVEIDLPPGIELVDTADGNSIINFWLDKPHVDSSSRALTFSGIIPGGFSGKGARLLVLTLKAHSLGSTTLAYNVAHSHIYINSDQGVEDPVTQKPVTLVVAIGKDNTKNPVPDTLPPEFFTPEITQSPYIADNKFIIVFETQDKGVGMDHYEEAESSSFTTSYDKLHWQIVQSPFVLQDQGLHSFVYIKAVDKNGNGGVEAVPPIHPLPWYERYWQYILIVLVLLCIPVAIALFFP
jgi:hypothetical protein